jgi:hypothetical protein
VSASAQREDCCCIRFDQLYISNKRVCTDCNSASKYVSKATGREIILRESISNKFDRVMGTAHAENTGN